MKQYIPSILLAALAAAEVQAQTIQPAPRLVVNIAIDQLRTDYIEHFSPLYSENGFKKLLNKGRVYESASYPFSPVDRASAIASIATGTTPHYNNIVSSQWLDRNTLRPIFCTDDGNGGDSPKMMATSTIGDELKVASRGNALVYSVAADKDAAILAGGHAADGAPIIQRLRKTFCEPIITPNLITLITRPLRNWPKPVSMIWAWAVIILPTCSLSRCRPR